MVLHHTWMSSHAEIKQCLSDKLYESAALLAEFALRRVESAPSSTQGHQQALLEATLLYGDALHALQQFKRAIKYYQQSLHLSVKHNHELSQANHMYTHTSIREKIAESLLCLGEEGAIEAIATLEAIRPVLRSVRSLSILAKLYEQTGRIKDAIMCYRNVLSKNPVAMAATLALIRLDVDFRTVTTQHREENVWMDHLAEAHNNLIRHNHSAALKIFNFLLQKFPRNVHLLVHKANAQLQLSDPSGARKSFEYAHEIDAFNMDSMDMLAWILRTRGEVSELNTLTHELIALDRTRPEPWIAVALYCDHQNDREKTLSFLDQAISLDKRHIGTYLVKGFIALSMGNPEKAVEAYRCAHRLDRRELAAYQGLVEAYLAIPKFQEALHLSKTALQLLPKNPRALTLFGMVLVHSPEGRERARSAFDKALSYDAQCIDAILALVKLLASQKKIDEAIKLLERHLSHQNKDFMHTKLANLYAQNGDAEQALLHYHTALSLSPSYAPAITGIERLEDARHNNTNDLSAGDEYNGESGGSDAISRAFDSSFG